MTEAEWLACQNPRPMLDYLGGKASGRKLRLFACACWPGQLSVHYAERSKKLLELAERYADGEAVEAEWQAARRIAYPEGLTSTLWADPERAVEVMIAAVETTLAERSRLAGLLREVLGNPFRRAALNPAWLAWNDATVPKLARAIYEGRAFDGMPILADALEEAGCTDQEILTHCRGSGPHVRGCWVIDLILGEEARR